LFRVLKVRRGGGREEGELKKGSAHSMKKEGGIRKGRDDDESTIRSLKGGKLSGGKKGVLRENTYERTREGRSRIWGIDGYIRTRGDREDISK